MTQYRAPLIAGLVAVLLAVLAWFFLFQPQREEQAELQEEVVELQARQSRLRAEIARLEEIAANEVAFRARIARLEEFIPTGTAQPSAIRQFQLTADAAGVEIESVSFASPTAIEGAPETGTPGTVLASISLTMSFEGGYFQVVDFFRRLELVMPRAVLVDAITMAEGSLGYPSLLSTWSGQLFSVVPVAQTQAPPPDPAPGEDEDAPDEPEEEAA